MTELIKGIQFYLYTSHFSILNSIRNDKSHKQERIFSFFLFCFILFCFSFLFILFLFCFFLISFSLFFFFFFLHCKLILNKFLYDIFSNFKLPLSRSFIYFFAVPSKYFKFHHTVHFSHCLYNKGFIFITASKFGVSLLGFFFFFLVSSFFYLCDLRFGFIVKWFWYF